MLVDAHAHIDVKDFDKDRDQILKKCNIIVVNAGVDLESNLKSLELEKKYSNVIAAVGFHPEFVKDKINELDKCLELVEKARIISEVGLDYFWVKEDELRKKEIEILSRFLEIGEKEQKPLIIHVRGGFNDLVTILSSYKVKFVIHAFEGSIKNAKRVIELGGLISMPPILLRDKTRQEIIKNVDLEYILTETDSPFMAHEKMIRNEPCNVQLTIEKIAELKNIDIQEVEKKIENNFKKLLYL
ncbi:TatD family hydrolase [Sulfurisphaera ohwakuensis]|uniref:TatD DNase family protein n=1 Tax=Sulfurisphaera ohwakuensis TaxID=69656 RepID=A0A650CIY7_SULOH|nr:TatD family hydrolase [Sulfurisphaera ohwakuensis]MBB5253367.1 TatD DNase family protein [Sulfurisphaera ohwakuensis]QGR17688.1 TatD family deoxyribonuclease [Sulfurisphaera ohwakuensis]